MDEVQHVSFETMAPPKQLRYGCMLEVACRRLEHGYKPVREPDSTWTIHRPDGQPITPAA